MTAISYNAFVHAQAQVDRIAALLGIDDPVRQLIRRPLREYSFSIPVRIDNGESMVFQGFRIQHNDALGPCKGGIRFHPQETLDGIRALAMWNTWKSAIVNVPLGGSMGGVVCDPRFLSANVQEKICRGWIRQMSRSAGPHLDIPEPDVMTNAQHMLWMLDEFESVHYGRFPGSVTGKPVTFGGSCGAREATGFGMIFMLREALKELDLKFSDTTAAVQGFGNVARHAVNQYAKCGGTVLAIACLDQQEKQPHTFRKRDGIKYEELALLSDQFGNIDKSRAAALGYEVLPGNAWLRESVDILLPAAFEYQITAANVTDIGDRVRVIIEGANGPVAPDADQILADRGLLVIPDTVANSGGVISSYFEQVQSNANHYWTEDEVFGKLDFKMTGVFHEVYETSVRRRLSMRDAALCIGIGRVADACRERGWV
ncbi:MAG: Glu/Leu/Phe/Val dehydrogenase [candidate division Zixibacteria bacterium]|nr:Glu/Leu/Phe/Val dehydrogenase [candidate division Zixibacteria bacterium]